MLKGRSPKGSGSESGASQRCAPQKSLWSAKVRSTAMQLLVRAHIHGEALPKQRLTLTRSPFSKRWRCALGGGADLWSGIPGPKRECGRQRLYWETHSQTSVRGRRSPSGIKKSRRCSPNRDPVIESILLAALCPCSLCAGLLR
jgi:hypothetical protein